MADKDVVLKHLREHHQTPLVPLTLPDEDDLIDIEEAIYVQIRGEFRTFLLEASDIIIGSLEPVTASDSGSHTYLPDIASEAWENGLPREMLPICKTSQGYYCLDLEDQVIYWQNEMLKEEHWPDIWDWAEEVWLKS